MQDLNFYEELKLIFKTLIDHEKRLSILESEDKNVTSNFLYPKN